MKLRRGFKVEANKLSREMRQELGLSPASRLCPWTLAKHLDFGLKPLSFYERLNPECVAFFRSDHGKSCFSATTLPYGQERWIIYNDSHDLKRQAADISHEIAHGLLLHPLHPLLDSPGSRHYNEEIEEEANWLGPALLISDEAAILIARRRYSLEYASDVYGASIEVVRFRLNVSGAYRRVAA